LRESPPRWTLQKLAKAAARCYDAGNFFSVALGGLAVFFDFYGLNWWAILVATIAGFMLGGVWYGPLFGKAWLRAIGKREEELGSAAVPLTLSFFTALMTAILMALLVNSLTTIETAVDGALLGLYIRIGFIAAAMASDYAFCRWPRQLFFIQAGYRVAYSVVMGAILAGWR
jgi:hypothetical protein